MDFVRSPSGPDSPGLLHVARSRLCEEGIFKPNEDSAYRGTYLELVVHNGYPCMQAGPREPCAMEEMHLAIYIREA